MHTSFEDSDVLGKFNDEPDKLPPLPLRLEPGPISGALQIAILVQSIPLQQAAALIEDYVRAECAGARLDEAAKLGSRLLAHIEAPLGRKSEERSDA
jgi:hypothetical protein